MTDIRIKPLEESDVEELFRFELENRDFFERTVSSRGDHYYEIDNFKSIIKDLVEEQKDGRLYMYLIQDDQDKIVGRVNLVSVERGCFHKAELGYRVGEIHNGKGYATKAVKLVLYEAATKHQLHRVEAGTSPDNIGSQVVLIKNGFQFAGRYNKYIYQNGKWHDSINFEVILN